MPNFFQHQGQYAPDIDEKLRQLLGQNADRQMEQLGNYSYEEDRLRRDAEARKIFEADANPEIRAGDIPGMILGAPGRLVQGLVGGLTGRGGGQASAYWGDRPDLKMALATGVQGLPETQGGNPLLEAITGAGERRATNMRGLVQALAARRKLVEEPLMEDRVRMAQIGRQQAGAAGDLTAGYGNLAQTEYGRGRTNAAIGLDSSQSVNALAHAALANRQGAAIDPRAAIDARKKAIDDARKRKLELRKLVLQGRAAAEGKPDPYGIPQPKADAGTSDEQKRLAGSRLAELSEILEKEPITDTANSRLGAYRAELQQLGDLLDEDLSIADPVADQWDTWGGTPAALVRKPRPLVAVRTGNIAGMQDTKPTMDRGAAAGAMAGHKGKKYDTAQEVVDAHNRNDLSYDEMVEILDRDFGLVP